MPYPCIACSRVVRPRQEAVECDWCSRWQHRTCGTGISQTIYKEAVRCEEPITFVCRPCLEKDNVLDQNVPYPDDAPPVLEISLPQPTDAATIIYDEPPELELSVPVTAHEEAFIEEYDDDYYMPENRHIDSDIVAEWEPIADSTALQEPATPPMDEAVHDDLTIEETPDIDLSFDITNRDIEEVIPIEERSLHDVLTETILHDGGVTYTLLEGGSQKRHKILISSLGYAYGLKRENKSSTVWRCNSRSRAVKCPVMLKQFGDSFHQQHEHLHAASTDNELKKNAYMKIDHDFIHGDEFLVSDIRDLDGQRHVLLATETQLQLLREARRWYMDGTFKVVGDPFKRNGQLMSIHAFIEKNGKSKQLPLVFCLMSRRTKEDYVVVLRALLRKLGHVDVQGFVLDYEQAAWLAIREVFPGKEVKGCAFHWSQAVWRRVQQVGLAETYRKRQGMHSFVRMLLSIQFLPADHIRRAFDGLAARASTAETIELVGYVRRQWVEGTTFRPCDWSVFKQTIRTNNDVEGWHHRLNGKAGASCLSFYRLVPLLHREAGIVKVAVDTGDLDRGSSVRSARLGVTPQRNGPIKYIVKWVNLAASSSSQKSLWHLFLSLPDRPFLCL